MSETGVVKFRCEHVAAEIAAFPDFDAINVCRRKLLQLGMIGVDAHGIGYGNVSVRAGDAHEFYITGSGTGGCTELSLKQFAKVTAYDFQRNCLRCTGGTIASSESLTHAAVYESEPRACAVIHCHDGPIWAHLLQRGLATLPQVEYGTPEMAFEVQRLFREATEPKQQIFAMAGHVDGVVAFGHDVEEAFQMLTREHAHARSS